MAKNVKRRLSKTDSTPEVFGSDVETFAHRLHHALLDKGWSQSDLARKVWGGETRIDSRGYEAVVGRDRISQYCRGKAMPAPATLKKIAQELDVTTEYLAPNLTASAIEREVSALKIEMAPGHRNRCLLRINRLVPLSIAVQVAKLIEEAEEADEKEKRLNG